MLCKATLICNPARFIWKNWTIIPAQGVMAQSTDRTRKRKAVEEMNASTSAPVEQSKAGGKKNEIHESPTPVGGRCKGEFFDVPCETLARRLLGQVLVYASQGGERLSGRIVETECYLGGEDKASNTFQGRRTPANEPMYMKPGTMFVYMTYGMYYCINISSKGEGAAVLLRALEPLEGIHQMRFNRGGKRKDGGASLKTVDLCNGPSKLCQALNITKEAFNGKDLVTCDTLWVEKGDEITADNIIESTRIGIGPAAGEWAKKLLRYYVKENPYVSVRDKKQ